MAIFILAALAVTGGCGDPLGSAQAGSAAPAEETNSSQESPEKEGSQGETLEESTKEKGAEAEQTTPAGLEIPDADFTDLDTGHGEYVGIKAHIKEVKGDWALISSDTDGFPGVFQVYGPQMLTGDSPFKGGAAVFLVMADSGQKTADGIPIYHLSEIFPASEDGDGQGTGQTEELFTQPPTLTLTDPLSSSYDCFQALPGNYSWNVAQGNGTITSTIACGFNPLDETGLKSVKKLKIPSYQGADTVMYGYDTAVSPHKLVVRQWDSTHVGHVDALEERVITYYCEIPFLELEKGKVYEFAAQWDQKDLDKNGFWGDAAYVFVTE